MKPRINRRRRGVALVAALSLMTLLGLLIVGAVATTTIAERASRASLIDGPLGAAAELAAAAVLADPTTYGLADLQIGAPVTRSFPLTDAPAVVASITTTRLGGGLVWVVAESRAVSDTLAHRRVGRLARFPFADLVPRAAIVSGGPVTVAPDVTLGRDSVVAADCGQSAFADSIVTVDSTMLYASGWQRVILDSAAATRVRGDTTVVGGTFMGLLLVDGNLTITGSFTMSGLAVVRGKLVARHGLVLTGGVIAAGGVDVAEGSVKYSPCVIGQVVRRAIRPRPVSGRGWVEVF